MMLGLEGRSLLGFGCILKELRGLKTLGVAFDIEEFFFREALEGRTDGRLLE